MTDFDDTMRPLATELLTEFGVSITFSDQTASADYDPTTGAGTLAASTKDIVCSPPTPADTDRIDGTSIITGDMIMYSSGEDDKPRIGAKFTHDTKVWRVVSVNQFFSGAQVALYEIICRK